MRKFVSSIFIALVASIMVTSVLAIPRARDAANWAYGSGGQLVFSPPGHHNMQIMLLDIQDSSLEPHDVLGLYIWVDEPIYEFLPVKIVTDNAECAALNDLMFAGIPTWETSAVVADDELEIWRRGNMLFAELKVDVPLSSGLFIPASHIELRGCGGALHGTETTPLPSGYTITETYMGFNAFGIVVSHTWECPFPAVGAIAMHMHLTIAEPAS